MQKSNLILMMLVFLAGAILPIQAGFNIQIGKAVQQPVFAAFASFLIGTTALFLYLLAVRFNFSSISATQTVSPLFWTAGILGAFYVASVIIIAPRLGTALTFSLIVGGQMIISLILDHFGLLGFSIKEINWQRILGVIFLVLGVLLIRKY
ncbi:DMT family transporter [Marivirga arenosa]|uniref:DMT family transporter n=1 Tax=Marivirga arenosa TaxID=3059076 RepID=A0AA49JAC3_9BACT|nr:DMT family transporter [Marivirga sp. BKB1-2]WKK81260.2 DMT family transporter [Marivirga sp. BKB1-2]